MRRPTRRSHREGVTKAEKLLGLENLYDLENMEALHGINQGLAGSRTCSDGRGLPGQGQSGGHRRRVHRPHDAGRRWSDGLHQAVEAKEGVRIERENQTLATITFQNYFRLYDKLAGMTGTAETEATEFGEIYDLDVMVIPTNMPMVRDEPRPT